MTDFSRRARWLNTLFPASTAPQVQDPGVRSNDVSLTQPYDGGGFVIPDKRSWITQIDSPIGASGDTDVFTLGDDEIFRFFQMHAFTIATSNAFYQPLAVDLDAIPIVSAALADNIATLGVGAGNNVPPNMNRAMILPPGMTLRIQHFGGDATTSLRYVIYGCRAPVGSVFYL